MTKKSIPAQLPFRAAIYARVSSKQQGSDDKVSIDTQLNGCRAAAQEQGVPCGESFEFIDMHSGEELWERPMINVLREAAFHRQFSHVFCWQLDRLSRNPVHQAIVIDELERQGITIVFPGEKDMDDSPEGYLVRLIKGYGAQLENVKRVERSMRAKREFARRGIIAMGSRKLFGYVWNKETSAFEHNEATKKIVVRIFHEYDSGKTLRQIALALTADGIPTPSGQAKPWDATSVRSVLRTPAYWGKHALFRRKSIKHAPGERANYAKAYRQVWTDESEQIPISPDVIPPIVTEELAMRVQERLGQNQYFSAHNRKYPDDAMLQRSMTECAYCKGHLSVLHKRKKKQGNHYTVYQCWKSFHSSGGCVCNSIHADILDPAVWREICAILRHPDAIFEESARMSEEDNPTRVSLENIERDINEISQKIARLVRLAAQTEDEDIAAAVKKELDELGPKKRSLEKGRLEAQANIAEWQERKEGLQTLVQWCQQLEPKLASCTLEDKRNVLKWLDVRVSLWKAGTTPRVEVHVNLPLSFSEQSSQDGLIVVKRSRIRLSASFRMW